MERSRSDARVMERSMMERSMMERSRSDARMMEPRIDQRWIEPRRIELSPNIAAEVQRQVRDSFCVRDSFYRRDTHTLDQYRGDTLVRDLRGVSLYPSQSEVYCVPDIDIGI